MSMNCPVCAVPLTMSTRQNVEIDYCQQCRGVWLDRGELDKIIERSVAELAPQAPPRGPDPAPPPSYGRPHDDRYKYKRKKSFLEELFD
ncbi:zf-TFIIB domain-containing protein [Rhizorhabdus wittichii]|uniref:Zf-TFIIB domain-containing protein n=1 Tax=Rhizorhabdus wittichii TaxID=160791 RepID=A0A975D4M6_9SPHN|nr:zf-TFIIB domain-containing protein [Rhizorhabdus wittichii]QTH22583.1 zf-TFIIB domain-containing protein [Rhizorhabdus wittichii]